MSLDIDIVFQFGVDLVSTDSISNPGETEAIKALHTYDVRILVLLVDDILSAGSFLLKALSLGSLGSNTVMLGSSDVTNTALWLSAASIPGGPSAAQIKAVLGGYIGILPADNDWKVSLLGLKTVSYSSISYYPHLSNTPLKY